MAFPNKLLNTFIGAFTGCVIFALPYAIFIKISDNFSSGLIQTFLMLISILLFTTLLLIGGWVSGMILSYANLDKKDYILFVLAVPGLYISLSGFVISYLIDGFIPTDGLVALSFMAVATTIVSGSGVYIGYKRHKILP